MRRYHSRYQKGSPPHNRMFVEGVLWIVRTALPGVIFRKRLGIGTVYSVACRWSAKGVWWRIFEAMSDDPIRFTRPVSA